MSTNNDTIKNKAIAGVIWTLGEKVCSQGVAFIITIILARLLSPDEYGLVTITSSFMLIFNIFLDGGFGNALIQKKDADETDFSTVFFFGLVISVVEYIMFFCLAPKVSYFFNEPDLTMILRIMGIQLPFCAIMNVLKAIIAKRMQFQKFFWATLGGTILSGVIGIVLAYKGYGAMSLVVQSVMNIIIDTFILWRSIKWVPLKVFSGIRLKRLFLFGGYMLFASILDTIYNQGTVLLIGKVYTTSQLSYFDKGKSYAGLVTIKLNDAIGTVLFPTLSAQQDCLDQVRAITRKTLKLCIYTILPISLGFILISKPVVQYLLTDKWLPICPFIAIFGIVYIIRAFLTTNLQVVIALGEGKLYQRITMYTIFTGFILLLLCYQRGPIWIAYSTLLGGCISHIIYANATSNLIGYSWIQQVKDVIPETIISIGMAVCVYGIGKFCKSNLLGLLVQILVGIITFIIFSILTKNESFIYILAYIREKMAGGKKNG